MSTRLDTELLLSIYRSTVVRPSLGFSKRRPPRRWTHGTTATCLVLLLALGHARPSSSLFTLRLVTRLKTFYLNLSTLRSTSLTLKLVRLLQRKKNINLLTFYATF